MHIWFLLWMTLLGLPICAVMMCRSTLCSCPICLSVKTKPYCFTDAGRLKAESAEALKVAGFEVLPYAQAADYLASVKGALLIDPNKTAVALCVAYLKTSV